MGGVQGYRLLMKKVIHHWLPSSALGGIEMAALTLIQGTPEVRHVVATGEANGPAIALWREAGAEVVHVSGWHGTLGLSWHRHWKVFVRQCNVRHLIVWSPTRLPQLLSPLSRDSQCIVHIGNIGVFSFRARLQHRLMSLAYRPVCLPTLVACSHAVAASIEEEPAFAGLPRIVIPNPVRAVFLKLGDERPILTAAPRLWGMLARLDKLKDHQTLIEAVRRLPEGVEFHLEIAGDGLLAEELRKQVVQAGLERRVRFLGALTHPQEAMRQWDAFVFATTAGEGFGIAAAEAMASRLPCVLSDVPAMREVAGNCAFYAAPASPAELCARIMEVIESPTIARDRAEQGKLRVKNLFGPKTFAMRYLSVLKLA